MFLEDFMIKFITFIFTNISNHFYRLLIKYYRTQLYTDVCLVWSNSKNTIKFETASASGEVHDINTIRRTVGQNKIALFGPFQPHRIVLLVKPSVYRHHGFFNTRRFIKSWFGVSKVNGNDLIYYTKAFRRR